MANLLVVSMVMYISGSLWCILLFSSLVLLPCSRFLLMKPPGQQDAGYSMELGKR